MSTNHLITPPETPPIEKATNVGSTNKTLSKSLPSKVETIKPISPRPCTSSVEETPNLLQGNGTIAIRREDKSRWERRAPLSPHHVGLLVSQGLKVLVQPSTSRVFPDSEYKANGAILTEDLSSASLVLGIKEVPPHKMMPNRTYMFFAEVLKALSSSMPVLDAVKEKNIRLIDYEQIRENGVRKVAFGKYAGIAGTIDFLHCLGDRFLAMGHYTPFLNIGFTHMYPDVNTALSAIHNIRARIQVSGLPRAICPLIFVVTGVTGRAAQGSLEVLQHLPLKIINSETAAQLVEDAQDPDKEIPTNLVYLMYAPTEAMYEKRDPDDPPSAAPSPRKTAFAEALPTPSGGLASPSIGSLPSSSSPLPSGRSINFDKKDFRQNPQNYRSVFATKFARYASVIINCIYWDWHYPRLLTIRQLREMAESEINPLRLIGVCDISCDVGGSLQFLVRRSTIDNPWYIYNVASSRVIHNNIYAKGIMMCAIDNLPTELPYKASLEFSNALSPFIASLATSNGNLPYDQQNDIDPLIHAATLVAHGKLTPSYEYIEGLRNKNDAAGVENRILLIGAGFVAGPVVEYLLRNPNNALTISDVNEGAAKRLAAGRDRCTVLPIDTRDEEKLKGLIAAHNIVVTLIPAAFVHPVIRACLSVGKNMLTASYKADFDKYHQQFVDAGLTMLNEVGLDPGIDHLTALSLIDRIKSEGGKLTSFVSWVGGLPAPEFANNALGYKFSWNPAGAMMSGHRAAKYKKDGKIIELADWECFAQSVPVEISPGFNLEGFPNRDSMPYAKYYEIDDTVQEMFRGTLRFQGFTRITSALSSLGFYTKEKHPDLLPGTPPVTWKSLFAKLLKARPGSSIKTATIHRFNMNVRDKLAVSLVSAFEELGFYSDELVVKSKDATLYDALVGLVKDKLVYNEGEKDMVIMHHILKADFPDGRKKEYTSGFVAYGDSDWSSMAQTVGFTTAIAAQLLLDGTISEKGVIAPFKKEVWQPILRLLQSEGFIHLNESEKEIISNDDILC